MPVDECRDPADEVDEKTCTDLDYIFVTHYQTAEEKLSLSILYNNPASGRSNLNLIFMAHKDLVDFHDALLACIRWNIAVPKLVLQNLDYSLLRIIFIESGKSLDDKTKSKGRSNTMTKADFLSVLESKLGVVAVDKKDVNKMWSTYCTSHHLTKDAELSAIQCTEILQFVQEKTAAKNVASPSKVLLKMIQDQPANIDSSILAEVQQKSMAGYITAAQFLSFLRHEQKEETVSLMEIKELFQKINQQRSLKVLSEKSLGSKDVSDIVITKEAFLQYLQSDDNDAFNPVKGWSSRTNMNMPLSSYWINTSHDASQNNGQGPEVVIFALTRGCRCIELTLWDSRTNEPLVCRR